MISIVVLAALQQTQCQLELPSEKSSAAVDSSQGMYTSPELHRIQLCSYATLLEFKRFAGDFNVQWTLSEGSARSATCFNAMSPWDDDIDVQVARNDGFKMLQWWHRGTETLDYNFDEHWNQRYVLNKTHLLYKFVNGSRFKLIPVTWRIFATKGEYVDLGGLDIFVALHENKVNAGILHEVKIGPLLAYIVPLKTKETCNTGHW